MAEDLFADNEFAEKLGVSVDELANATAIRAPRPDSLVYERWAEELSTTYLGLTRAFTESLGALADHKRKGAAYLNLGCYDVEKLKQAPIRLVEYPAGSARWWLQAKGDVVLPKLSHQSRPERGRATLLYGVIDDVPWRHRFRGSQPDRRRWVDTIPQTPELTLALIEFMQYRLAVLAVPGRHEFKNPPPIEETEQAA